MNTSPVFILAVLALLIAVSEWLGRNTWLRHLGSALVVIVLTAVVANVGVIPTYSDSIPVYSGVFGTVAPMAIFLLLLQVNLKGILKAGLPMVGMFLLGAVGTVAGVLAGMAAVGGRDAFGEFAPALGGMFTGTYIGGSINYNAVALHFEVVKEGTLYAGAAAVDSAMTALWMAVTVALPRLLTRKAESTETTTPTRAPFPAEPADHDTERVGPLELSLLVALGAFGVWLSDLGAEATGVPSVLILTTLALALAQIPWIHQIRGARLAGWLAVMLFLAVIGALCDLEALAQMGPVGMDLLIFVTVILAVHGALLFGLGALFKIDPALTAVASQANIGGSTSALALARSLSRESLVLPGILMGALGNALGTYLGFAVAAWLV